MATLLNRWPLTSNANGVVGSLNLTNVGSVVFSADGAYFPYDYNKYLQGTISALSGSFSFNMWVKTLSWDKIRYGVFGIRSGAGTGTGFDMYSGTALIDIGGNGTGVSYPFNSTNFPSAPHTMFTVTCAGPTGAVELRRNGVLVSTGTSVSYNSITNFVIGKFGDSSEYLWDGYILDFRKYSGVLSSAEALVLYSAGPNDSFLKVTTKKSLIHPSLLSTSIGQK